MSRLSRRTMLTALAVAPVAIGAVAPSVISGSDKKVFKNSESPREKLQKLYFPNFELTTHEGKKDHFYDDLIKDKIVVIDFMYVKCEDLYADHDESTSECRSCWEIAWGRDISCNRARYKPEEDTPAKLNEYVKAHHIMPGWTLLTGNPTR